MQTKIELEDRVAKLEDIVKAQQEVIRTLSGAFAGHQRALEALGKHTGLLAEVPTAVQIESTLLH